MIQVSIMYPNSEARGSTPTTTSTSTSRWPSRSSRACVTSRSTSASRALAAPRRCAAGIVHFTFDSMEAFGAAFGLALAEVGADIANYTDIAGHAGRRGAPVEITRVRRRALPRTGR